MEYQKQRKRGKRRDEEHGDRKIKEKEEGKGWLGGKEDGGKKERRWLWNTRGKERKIEKEKIKEKKMEKVDKGRRWEKWIRMQWKKDK